MSREVDIRIMGRAGRITLARPEALNALTHGMVDAIDAALRAWAVDDRIAMVVIDAEGTRAFCAGGDIADLYASGRAGEFAHGRRFWRDEYRMNARLFDFPKPVAAFLQGFTMGGGVGVGCHGSHRIVAESAKIAMPECGIGLIPDVGGSLILARAPGRLGEYLALTGARMGPGDAIHAGFADYLIPEADWPALIADLQDSGDWHAIDAAAHPAPDSPLAALGPEIDALFGGERLPDIANALAASDSACADAARAAMARNAPLSMACALEVIHRVRARQDIRFALDMEYRFTARAMEHGDFLEGIRAAIIDKDKSPRWRHDGPRAVPMREISAMLRPLGPEALTWEETT